MAYPGSFGTIKIIPASVLRSQQYWNDPSFSQDPRYGEQSINSVFYMGSMYNAGYTHEPYGHNVFIDPIAYGEPQQYPYYGGYSYGPYGYQGSAYPGAYGPYPGTSGAYRPFPQPQPSPPRRSRTAPNRTGQRTQISTVVAPERRKFRAFSSDPCDRRLYKAYSGPVKKPLPIYRKRREPTINRIGNFQETDFTGCSPMDYNSQFTRPYFSEVTPTLRRVRPFYAPSYTTYPPSTMHRPRKRLDPQKYPLFARIAIKVAQLILGAAVLGLVLGPMRGSSFHDFAIRTNTEWQGVVVAIVAIWSILTAILLLTSFLANSVHAWRKLDAHITLIGILAYLVASCLEAYYAACYPPNGAKINLVCHRAEWIIACILCFINTTLYVIDFVMSWISGVTML